MNIFNIIDQLQKVDGDAIERLQHASRRQFMNHFSSKVAAAAAPMLFATVMNKAYAQSAAAKEVLEFALTLEYLENEFYKKGNKSGIIPDMYKKVFETIGKHETQHVEYLQKVLGIDPTTKAPEFDFTYDGKLTDTFTNFSTFVTVSAALEDTGVRAYKGQAGNLMMDPGVLEVALQIHSVEARHAAESRRIFAIVNNAPTIKGWITNNNSLIPLVQAIYDGEDNVIIGGADLNGIAGKSHDAITEAFDEILMKQQVIDIATPFLTV